MYGPLPPRYDAAGSVIGVAGLDREGLQDDLRRIELGQALRPAELVELPFAGGTAGDIAPGKLGASRLKVGEAPGKAVGHVGGLDQ